MTRFPPQRWFATAMLSAGMVATVAAQEPITAPPPILETTEQQALLPVLDPRSGRVEAMLLLESPIQTATPKSPLDRVIGPASGPRETRDWLLAHRRPLAGGALDGSLSIEANTGMALLCDSSAVLSTLGALAEHCLLTKLDDRGHDPLLNRGRGIGIGARVDLGGDNAWLSLNADLGHAWIGQHGPRFALPPYLAGPAGSIGGFESFRPNLFDSDPFSVYALSGSESGRIELERLGLTGVMRIGQEGWVSLGGSLSRAQLIPTYTILPGPLGWSMNELTLGAGYRAFSGSITSRVIEIPGQSGSLNDIDIGLTWRTPWSARISIGARNVSGPTTPAGVLRTPELDVRGDEGEATIPYVRYRQDL